MSREAVELAREEDPYTLAAALILTANVHLGLGERDRAREQAEEVIAIGRERGFPDLEAMGTGCRGLALGGARGLEELQRGKAQFAATRVETISVARHWSLAEANLNRALGRTEQALAVLEPAFATESGARNAGLHQEKGEILVQRGTTDEAEHCFRRALEIARKQEAKSLELRTATSLACLLRDQGQGEEARMLLQPVYHWFTEGFDTADLKEAKALLEELS
jgi:tetratricopeptide (TPR) repeat protein